jgi:hypothetical protein
MAHVFSARSNPTLAKVDPLENPRLLIVLATVALNIVAVALLTLVPWSNWRTGVALNILDNGLLVWFVITRGDRILGSLIFFGLAVGFTELTADAWLVKSTRTLDYSIGGGPMLWCSPAWMPFAWEVVTVQFSCLGLWLWRRLGALGLLAAGLLGAVNIPYYEEMARPIHWWQYHGCRMISGTPFYIIGGELLIAIALTLLAKPIHRETRFPIALLLGVAGGVAIFAAYALAFVMFDVYPGFVIFDGVPHQR